MPSQRLFMKFTHRSIEAIKPKAERFEVWETNGKGFGLRISPAGKKSWIYLYRFDGRARRLTLGAYPDMGLADAHEAHAKAKRELSKGTDPGEKDQLKKAAHRNAFTVANLVNEYIERHAKKKKITWREDLRCLNKDVLPFIGKRKARDIENRDIVLLRDRIMDRGAEMMANRVHNCLTKLFNFGIERGLLKASPCAALSLPAEKVQRDRALSDAEIKIFWNSLGDTGMEISRQLALRLLLVTAQRRGEVVGAKWQEFNLNERVWEIPLERIKTRKKRKKTGPHLVPLNDLALSLLDEIKAVSNGSPFLFPWKTPGQHFPPTAVTSSLSRALNEKNPNRIKVKHFTPHDLRRTSTTSMTGLGISQSIAGKILNHAPTGVIATVYDKYNYLKEKTEAMNRWGQKLESILTGQKAKIVSIHK